MKRRFTLTPEAKKDLREIFLDLVEENPERAELLSRKSHLATYALKSENTFGQL